VLVIGAGIGGLTAAIHLARAGFRVTILEKNAEAGGRCGRLIRDGHRFDTGPTLLVMPLLYEAEFEALGLTLRERLDLLRVDPTYRLVFDDASQLALTSDATSMRRQLEAIEPGSFDGLRRYVACGGRHYRIVLDRLVDRQFRSLLDMARPADVGPLLRLDPFANHYRTMGRYFRSARLKSAFTFQDLYVGLSPFEAPATLSMLSYTELAHGVWYPRGGMYGVVEALVDLARADGVGFAFGTTVARIDTAKDRVGGVTLADGSRLEADVVLANADLPWVYEHLLPPDRTARSLARMQFSCSAISFLWGLDRPYEELGPHTLFLADGYRENFDAIVRDLRMPANPSLYVHAPGRLDPSVAPAGHDSVTAIVPVAHLRADGGEDWPALRDEAREHVFRRLRMLGVTDIAAHIKFEEAYTPQTWARRYNLAKGSTHGLSHRLTQMAAFRPSNRHRRYRNLYFAGSSTRPGTGIPITMVSGRLAAERIAAEAR
jgi:phytoene desaturase